MKRIIVSSFFLLIFMAFCLGNVQEKSYEIEANGKTLSLPLIHESSYSENPEINNEKDFSEYSKKIQEYWVNPINKIPDINFINKYKLIEEKEIPTIFPRIDSSEPFKDDLIKLQIYETEQKVQIGVIKSDDNNILVITVPTKRNIITGKEEPDYDNIEHAKPLYILRYIGNSSLFISPKGIVRIILGSENPVTLVFSNITQNDLKKFYNFSTEASIIDQAGLLLASLEKRNPVLSYYNYKLKFPIIYTDEEKAIVNPRPGKPYDRAKQKEIIEKKEKEKEKEYEEYLTGLKNKGSENFYAFNMDGSLNFYQGSLLTPDEKKLYWIDRNNFRMIQRIFLGEQSYPLDLPISDVVKNIEEDGNITTVYLNDNDYLKFSTYSNMIFEGKIKRKDGVWEIIEPQKINQDKFNAKFTFSKEFHVPFKGNERFGRMEAPIPIGSSMTSIYNNFILAETEPATYIVKNHSSINGNILDQNGKLSHTFNGNLITWEGGEEIINEYERKKQEERNAKTHEAYKLLCKKYGAKYVDDACGGDVTIGMPLGLIQEIFETKLWYNYGDNDKAYQVFIRPPLYLEDQNKISAKIDAYIPIGFREIIIHVNNGRVSSILYH